MRLDCVPACSPRARKIAPPLDPKNIDPSVKPGDDFFNYANGAWIKRTEIPPEYSRWGAFNELIERNNDSLHTIAEKASANVSRSEAGAGNTESGRLLRKRNGRKGDRSCAHDNRWPTSSRKSTRSKIDRTC